MPAVKLIIKMIRANHLFQCLNSSVVPSPLSNEEIADTLDNLAADLTISARNMRQPVEAIDLRLLAVGRDQ